MAELMEHISTIITRVMSKIRSDYDARRSDFKSPENAQPNNKLGSNNDLSNNEAIGGDIQSSEPGA